MSIFVDDSTRVVVQGITGEQGKFHAKQMRDYGTNVVAGAVPGKGGATIHGIPVFDTVQQAVREQDADASIIFVPPAAGKDALLEALDADLETIVAISEGIPMQDMSLVHRRLSESETVLIGPNSPGIITPGETKLGIMPSNIFEPGSVGIVSRSGTLTYQMVDGLTDRGIGQSTVVGIGGDPIIGTRFVETLAAFEADPMTDVVLLCGEIGGEAEEKAAKYIADSMSTPVVGFIAGMSAPPNTRMGHAGAIISGDTGTAAGKIEALEGAGARVARTPGEVIEYVAELR